MRVAKGVYLKDVPYNNLCKEEREAILDEARQIQLSTHIQLRIVRRKGRFVWRFLDRQ